MPRPSRSPGRQRVLSTAEGSRRGTFGPVEWTLLSGVALVWGSSFILIRISLESLAPATITWVRLTLGFLVLIAIPVSGLTHPKPSASTAPPTGLTQTLTPPSNGQSRNSPPIRYEFFTLRLTPYTTTLGVSSMPHRVPTGHRLRLTVRSGVSKSVPGAAKGCRRSR